MLQYPFATQGAIVIWHYLASCVSLRHLNNGSQLQE